MTDGTTQHDPHAETARVCVGGRRSCASPSGWKGESQDGAATPPRGRGLRPRHFRTRTTTNYILEIVCSSNVRETKRNLTLAEVVACV
jgi:hypothetical protein